MSYFIRSQNECREPQREALHCFLVRSLRCPLTSCFTTNPNTWNTLVRLWRWQVCLSLDQLLAFRVSLATFFSRNNSCFQLLLPWSVECFEQHFGRLSDVTFSKLKVSSGLLKCRGEKELQKLEVCTLASSEQTLAMEWHHLRRSANNVQLLHTKWRRHIDVLSDFKELFLGTPCELISLSFTQLFTLLWDYRV